MSQDKNIAFVAAVDFPNGLSITARIKNVAKVFLNMGFDCYVLSPYAPGAVIKGVNTKSEGIFEGIYFKCCNNRCERPPNNLLLIFWYAIGPFLVLKELFFLRKKVKLDYVYLPSVNSSGAEDLIYFLFCKLFRIRLVVDIMDLSGSLSSKEENAGFKNFLKKLKDWSARIKGSIQLKNADVIFYVSDYLREAIENVRVNGKLIYLPPLADASNWSVKVLNNKISNNIGSGKIIYAGNIKKFEGLDFLIESLTHLTERKMTYMCLIYGATLHNKVYTERIKNMIVENGLENFVHILPAVAQDRLYEILSGADVLVIPRRRNAINEAGFSQKFADYLISGVPILSTKFGEITKHLQDEVNIFFSDEGDSVKFADRIVIIIENPILSRKVGLAGRKYLEENFDVKKVAERMRGEFS